VGEETWRLAVPKLGCRIEFCGSENNCCGCVAAVQRYLGSRVDGGHQHVSGHEIMSRGIVDRCFHGLGVRRKEKLQQGFW
jgi:hypothetical protein